MMLVSSIPALAACGPSFEEFYEACEATVDVAVYDQAGWDRYVQNVKETGLQPNLLSIEGYRLERVTPAHTEYSGDGFYEVEYLVVEQNVGNIGKLTSVEMPKSGIAANTTHDCLTEKGELFIK